VRISERRARLLGLDATVAQKLELSSPVPVTSDPRDRMTDEQLLDRLETVVQMLVPRSSPSDDVRIRRALRMLRCPDAPEPQPEPVDLTDEQRLEQAYSQALAVRRKGTGEVH
jgi:hypothetical protein